MAKKISWVDMVKHFHNKFGHQITEGKSLVFSEASFDKLIRLRAKLINEEHNEVMTAIQRLTLVDDKVSREGLTDCVDGLCDLIFVLLGTALSLGVDMEKAMKSVYLSNMSKLDADGTPIHREDGKILKGPNYFPPNFEDCF